MTITALLLLPFCAAAALAAPLELRLWGQVLDADGRPLRALVVAGDDSCSTDESGNYAFASRPAGWLDLLVRPQGGDSFRKRVYLRREGFLPLAAPRELRLLEDLPGPAPTRPAGHPAGWGPDLDGDGAADVAGWDPLEEPTRRRLAGLEATDPWNWPLAAPADPGALSTTVWQPAGHPDFFSGSTGTELGTAAAHPSGEPLARWGSWLRRLPTRARTAPPLAGASVAAWGGSAGRQGGSLFLPLGLGPWQELSVESTFDDRTTGGDGDRQARRIGLLHRWLLPAGPVLQHRLNLGRRNVGESGPLDPALWLPGASALELRSLDRQADEAAVDGRLSWPLSADLRVEAGWRLRWRGLDTRALELDRVNLRTVDADDSRELWFDTDREDRRRLQGFDAGLDLTHERGRLQMAFGLQEQKREARGALRGVPGDPGLLPAAGVARWSAWDEQRVDVDARLRDVYRLSGAWQADVALDLRYRYDRFDRLPVGNFARASEERLDFSSDLLSFEPRLALRRERASSRIEAAWSRSRRPLEPFELWDGDQHRDALGAWPQLLQVEDGGFVSNELLLVHPRRDRLELAWWSEGRSAGDRGLVVFGERRDLEPLAWAVPESETWTPNRVRQGAPPRWQAGLDAWIAGERAGWRWRLDAAFRRGWAEGLRRVPGAGSEWLAVDPDAAAWPLTPPAALGAGLARDADLPRLGRLDGAFDARWTSRRSVEEWASGPGLPARFELDLRAGWRPRGLPDWRLGLGVDNLLDDDSPQWARVERLEPLGETRLWTAPTFGRCVWLRLEWTGGPR